MAAMWKDFSDWFWSESFWLPAHSGWKDLVSDETTFIPQASDLWIPIPVALVIGALRILFERYIATPIGRSYKLRETSPTRVVYNEVLEVAFKKHRKIIPNHSIVEGYAKQIDWSERQVERWWRRRRVQGKSSELRRFTETSWRFLFYICAFFYGITILWDKPWLWNTKFCWYGWPRQHMSDSLWYYYIVELSFYWSLIFSLMFDVKRKDFTENVVHHFVTITLMMFSYSINMVRIGSLVLVLHDAVDYFLEGAKLAKYMRFHKLCDALFVIFTVMWFLTRIVLFPLKVLRASLFEAHVEIAMAPIYYPINGLLLTLQTLNTIWFYYIFMVAYTFVSTGKVEKDERSETEPDSESDSEKEILAQKQNNVPHTNGVSSSGVLKQKLVNGERHVINNNMK